MTPHSATVQLEAANRPQRLVQMPLMVQHFDIAARTDNTGAVYVGGPETTNGALQGFPLLVEGDRGDIWSPPREVFPVDLHDLWIDGANAGDGVSLVYWI